MSRIPIDNPTETEVHRAYLAPQANEHWSRISKFVMTGGFGVEPNPETEVKSGQMLPEFKVTWPNETLKKQDYEIFFHACQMIIGTLDLDDLDFAQSTAPTIFLELQKSHLFTQLFTKESKTQNTSVQNHIEAVPTLIQTDSKNLRERFILRTVGVFHDIGKAFDIGRDQVHYHALIASNIINWFMETYKNEFVNHLVQFDKRSQIKVISVDEKGKSFNQRVDFEKEFLIVKNQITEIIRLHHVLEQIDKDVLDLNTVAAIFETRKINPLTYALFVIADGTSAIPYNIKYAWFLSQNLNALAKLIDMPEYKKPENLDVVKLNQVLLDALLGMRNSQDDSQAN